jgi:flagellin
MSVINTNVKALYTQAAMKTSGREQASAMEQLSTGKRINSAKDDAAGLAIATRMTQQIRSLNQAVRNAGDAISMIQTAEGATMEITDMMQRMRELAVQAINDTNSGDQRAYLDLEFQQLKQEIVRISDTTEWNGFSILNGTAGEAVGERPVYKATSEPTYGTVFISPTTTRDIGGAQEGEKQTITFAAATTGGTITYGGVNVTLPASAADTLVASTVAAALSASDAYGPDSGRTVTASNATVIIQYAGSEGEIAAFPVFADSAVASGTAISSPLEVKAISTADELFDSNGKFLQSGSLTVSVTGGAATATFTASSGEIITMTAGAPTAAGTVTFTAATGNNAQVISDNLTYTFKDTTATPLALNMTARTATLSVDVPGSVPAMNTGDLVINGVTIGSSYTSDDALSPSNNASGSAIAKAAAVNRYTDLTGVNAIVNVNTMTGTAQTGTSVVTGRVVINGFTSPTITSVLNNTRESRVAAMDAINRISDKTGVVAVNSDSDTEGLRLVAADGRNIEITFSTSDIAATFGARTGLKEGVQAGTYSLESKVEAPIIVTTTATGDPARATMRLGDYSTNESTLLSATRAVVASSGTPLSLSTGDLVINGVSIPGATAAGDTKTESAALTTLTNTRAASGVAMAAAINAVSATTGVTATATPAEITGTVTTVGSYTGLQSIWINGENVQVDFGTGTQTPTERAAAVVAAVNPLTGATGVVATANLQGGVTLQTEDGRNLSVWIDNSSNANLFGTSFGLGTTALIGGNSPGVTNQTVSGAITAASTVYGGVKLHSATAFSVEPGSNGYGTSSNFTALGFSEGTFGGIVDAAVTKMTPPNVGRLSFHVGASANQTVSVDLADFGSGGTITGDITGDVLLWDKATRVNRIDSQAAATAVLAKLDVAMDKVNGTRATMGAIMNRLEHTIDNLMNVSVNTSASRSQIEDADYAAASTELARTQIMQQAATAILAQANADQQGVLKLLQ